MRESKFHFLALAGGRQTDDEGTPPGYPATFWNLLIGGIPGWIVDGVSRAIWKLEPETITITLQTASIDGEDHQVLVFSWLDAQGEPVHTTVDVTN